MKKAFLFMLSLLAVIGIQAQTSPYTGSEAAAGNFYIYNVESGYWLQNNNRVGDWNSQVQVDVQGFDWELIAQDGGTWQLNPKFGNNHSLNSDADNGYMDTGRPVSAWTLTPVDGVSNGYTIESNGTKLGVNLTNNLLTKDGSGAVVWQLVTAEERLAKLVAQAPDVKADAPVDITWMIPGANINIADERFDQLVITYPDNAGAKLPTNQGNSPVGNCVREIWSNGGSYDLGYTLTGLPDGVYRFVVSGFYRDGSTAGIGAKVADGTQEIRSIIYINEKTQPLMSVCQRTSSGNGCNVQTGSYYVPNNLGDARLALTAGYYVNPPVKVVVNDGTIKLGLKADSGVGDDWMVLDYFKLLYYGPDNIEASVAILNAAIEEAEGFDTSLTSDAMAAKLADAITAAKAKLTSTDGDEMEAEAEALKEVLNEAKSLDLSVLKATAALAKQEGIDTSAADDILANALDGNAATALLEELRTARKIKALGGAEDIYPGAAPAADTEYYFYNLGTGMWLSAGSDWNTHAAVDQAGWLFKLNESGAGFTITSSMGSFNNSPYVDTGVNTVYTFQAVDGKEGVYNILEGSDLLGWNPDGKTDGKKYWNSVSNTTGADPADPNFQWKLVTKADRDLILESAKKDAPVDATYLINNPSLLRKPGYEMWTKEVNGGNGGARVCSQDDGNGDRAADYGWEVWNADNFKFYQKIEGLKPGVYEVSVQGFWREGDGGNQVNIVNDGAALNQKAYLYANDAQELLPNIASCLDFVPGVGTAVAANGAFPNWPREAFEFFETGAYKATVQATVDDDGVLTIGVGCDEKVTYGDWVVFDNFRLTYLGYDEAAALQAKYERALATLQDGKTYRIFTETADGAKRYLSPVGYLVDNTKAAATFTFNKVEGEAYKYGFLVDAGTCRFSNPPGTNESNLKCGYISTSSAKRANWDAQVFFLNTEGKYAVRCTNATATTSGWGWVGSSYWTVEPASDSFVAQYGWDPEFIWQIEENTDERIEAFAKTQEWTNMLQSYEGLVTDPAQYTSNAVQSNEGSIAALLDNTYETYFHSCWSNGPAEDHYLQAELTAATDQFYFFFKKRHNNNNNRPTKIVISGSNDGQSFTDITTVTEGLPTSEAVLSFMSQKITASEAYKFIRFTVLETSNNAECNGHKFFTFSEFYILPGDGITDEATKYMVSSYTDLDFEDVTPINELDALLNTKMPELPVNVIFNGDVVKTENVKQVIGKAPIIPASFDNGLVTLSDPDVATITDATQEVNLTATFNGPFEFSTDPADAKWYNMTIRGSYFVSKKDTEPYYPGAATDLEKISDEFQWAFAGSPYDLVIFNKATGTAQSLTKDGNNVVLRDGMYAWELFGNTSADGFVIREPGTETNWVNQNGGASGPLQFWNSTNGRNDNGSTFRVSAVPDASTIYGAALAEALAAANEAAAVPAGALFAKSADDVDAFKAAIAEQQAVADNAAATPEELKAALEALAAASATFSAAPTVAPEDGAKYTFQMAYTDDGVFFMNLAEGESSEDNPKVTIQAKPTVLTFVAADTDGQYYLKAADADLYLGKNGTNSWDMTADPAKKAAWTFTAQSDGSYVINDPATAKYVAATAVRNNNKVTPVEGDAIYFDKSATNGYVNWLIAPFAAPAVVLNAPTWNVEAGTQAEPNWIPVGETLKVNFTADNLEANGLTADDVKVKVTVLVAGDLPDKVMDMQSETAHRVQGQTFEIPLGETDFPVALKEGYLYQRVAVLAAQLVKGEEVVAEYAGAPAMLVWIGQKAPIKGDTNNDGEVDVADHGVIRDNILADADYDANLDINEDQYVDCADLTAVVNIILYGDWQGEPDPASGVRGQASADVLTLNYVSNGRYALALQSSRSYNSFQMDLDIPEGMTLVSEEAGSHTVMTSRLENGKTRVLVFSLNNAAFEGNEVLYLNVAGEGTLSADNIIFADKNANAVRMTLGYATGINGIQNAADGTIYDISGRKSDTMRRGVNIIRKADGTTKKVLNK